MADGPTMLGMVAIVAMAVFVMIVIGGGTYAAYRVAERPDTRKPGPRANGSSPDESRHWSERMAA